MTDDWCHECEGGAVIERLETERDRLREALERIVGLAASADSPSHSAFGRTNAWAGLGDEAVRIARDALNQSQEPS